MTAALSAGAVLRRLVGPGVAVAEEDPAWPSGRLLPAEAGAVGTAILRRRLEFTAGRVAARRAMAALGQAPRAVPMAPDRAPLWPEGLVGSIAHCAASCLAAVARQEAVRAIGIDLEPDLPLEPGLEPTICTAPERAWLDRQPTARRARLVRMIFSAKEAAYKAQYTLTGQLLDFSALAIAPDPGRFAAVFLRPVGNFAVGDRLDGRWEPADGLIVTAVTIPHTAPAKPVRVRAAGHV